MNREDKIFFGWLVGCFLAVWAVIVGGFYIGSRIPCGDGYRDSTVRRVAQKGVVFKTWEVETLGDGLTATTVDKTTTVSPETFGYTVDNPEVLETIKNLPAGRRVRIHYRQNLAVWFPKGESRYFITKVEILP